MTLVVPLQLAFNRVLDPATATTATVMVMLATSGLFEETTRWVVLRFAWQNQLPPFDDIPQLSELCVQTSYATPPKCKGWLLSPAKQSRMRNT